MFGESLIQSWLRSIMNDQSRISRGTSSMQHRCQFLRNIISCVSVHLSLLILPTECLSVLKWIDSPGTEQPSFQATRHLRVCRIIIGRILPLWRRIAELRLFAKHAVVEWKLGANCKCHSPTPAKHRSGLFIMRNPHDNWAALLGFLAWKTVQSCCGTFCSCCCVA